MRTLSAVISALIFGATMVTAAEESPESAALGALDDFIEAWNTGDNAELRKTLNYPFLTLFSPGQLEIAAVPEQFTVDFQRMRNLEDWSRSTFDESKAIAVTHDQVHIVTTYS